MITDRDFDKKYREKVLLRYNNVVGANSKKARDLIKKLDYKNDAYLLTCIAQTYYDESSLNEDNSQREYFEGRKLRLAEKYIIKAHIINENCIDVLWVMGKVRKAYRQFDLAIYNFKRLIKLGSRKIPEYDYCTSRSLVQIKVNDSRFQLYRIYHDLSDFKKAKRYLYRYKIGLKQGLDTIYKPLDNFLLD